MCLLEGTNLSEGRGTTRPFEWFGAPFLDSWKLSERLNGLKLQGVYFRPSPFQPTFQKHANRLCGGAFIHVTDRAAFSPPLTAFGILRTAAQLATHDFRWNDPPYEYEEKLPPIDILAGGPWIRQAVQESWPLKRVEELFDDELLKFEVRATNARIYQR